MVAVAIVAVLVWVGLLIGRGGFWRADVRLGELPVEGPEAWPTVCAVVPARNEASVLSESLGSLFAQVYPGRFEIVLVDDRSDDGTGEIARALAAEYGTGERFTVLTGEALPEGWTGKLWAVEQGMRAASGRSPVYWLLTDADICHDPDNLRTLVAHAERERRDLVSLMVRLRCRSFWEKLLIPAFVFFFMKLYPFAWVNDPANPTAAAAGGCILVRREALARAGGIAAVRANLIDDCALAAAVKGTGGRLWLGLAAETRSLRPYPTLDEVWNMIARTAFSQLAFSPWLLSLTVVGMVLLYLAPPTAALVGLWLGDGTLALAGLVGWGLMALAYLPTLLYYRRSPLWSLALPAIGALYTAMTVDSALRHWRGEGGAWKGRTYA